MPTGKKLEEQCKRFGVDVTSEPRTQSASGSRPRASDFELQRRLIEAKRSRREWWLWLVALVSAVASALSAAAAWYAAMPHK